MNKPLVRLSATGGRRIRLPLLASILALQSTSSSAEEPAPVPVTAIKASVETIDRVINGIGTVAPLQSVNVRPRTDGQVTEISFTEGQLVTKGSVLLKLDDRELVSALTSAQAKRAQDQAQLNSAQMDAQRYAALAEKGVASASTLEQKNAASEQYAAAVQYDDAQIKNAETQLSFATVIAPISGRTGFKQVDVGSLISASSTDGIVTITQMDPIAVSFVAPGDRFGEIRDALKEGVAEVQLVSTDGSRVLAKGQLTTVDNAVDASNGSIHLRATFDNKDGALWPGLPVATTLTVEKRNGVVVPDKALARGRDGLYAYVVGQDGKVQKRTVKTAYVTNARALVVDGIGDGDQVVMDGQSRIGDGDKVQVTPWTGSPTGELAEKANP
ncbi:efflux RND transporter periplasmic adaptor subunit [Agrobacterium rubi]|uniref:efflux RND transporter periplasmic adaptor subunit n=1 Tax=Agrobacterium rubi TaxID=28099 RepID=UPI0015718BB3|nr:efflux RND transporter periplasmic adaptor subunit [Agrobacterium rubi]NTF08954.1 efflux RND transporter periplasmic adaptor subunit [Agrobacterium rubi]NTF21225.1 efflux RND transporter periplasmic adaptor subunit [Agrobacterium rubi]NTF28082.1 efflux RND transporter periplasmic adaptor subunit [Agrobacterium rubi]